MSAQFWNNGIFVCLCHCMSQVILWDFFMWGCSFSKKLVFSSPQQTEMLIKRSLKNVQLFTVTHSVSPNVIALYWDSVSDMCDFVVFVGERLLQLYKWNQRKQLVLIQRSLKVLHIFIAAILETSFEYGFIWLVSCNRLVNFSSAITYLFWGKLSNIQYDCCYCPQRGFHLAFPWLLN